MVFGTNMVWRAFWISLGLILGALGGLLGALWGLEFDTQLLTPSGYIAIWALLGISLVSPSWFGVLLLASSWFGFFEVLSCRLLGLLRVDFELQEWPSEPKAHDV